IEQPITKRVGDGVRIDWGYAYLTAPAEPQKVISFGNYFDLKNQFLQSGIIKSPALLTTGIETIHEQKTVLAYTHHLKAVNQAGAGDFLMLGYDDNYSIEYFYKRRLAYWKHDGKVSMTD